jgi:hypothetical protein
MGPDRLFSQLPRRMPEIQTPKSSSSQMNMAADVEKWDFEENIYDIEEMMGPDIPLAGEF